MPADFPTHVSRPWILTTIGILSIIIASVSLLADFITVAMSNSMLGVTAINAPQPIINPPPAPQTTQAPAEIVAASGLAAAQRQIVIDGLSQVQSLTEPRRAQLDDLLTDAGQQIIQLSLENLTARRIATYVTEAHQVQTAGGQPDDEFTLGSGRLQVSDSYATFFPSDDSKAIRSVIGSYTDGDGRHISTKNIARILDRIQSLAHKPLTAGQLSSMQSEFESATQTLITPGASSQDEATQITQVQTFDDGTVAITTSNTPAHLSDYGPPGNSMSFSTTGQSYPGAFALGAMQAQAAAPPVAQPRVFRRDTTLLMVDGLFSFVAAGFLLFCGILTLRNAGISRWLNMAWAVVKLCLVVLSCYAVYRVAFQLASASDDPAGVARLWMLWVSAVGVIYPLVLLVVMNLKPVREFLAAPTVARIF